MKARAHSRKPPTPSDAIASNIPAEELNRLLQLRHRDPHSILGAHPTDRGVIIRAYRPDAQRIFLIVDDGKPPLEMTKRPEPGLFEILVLERHEVFQYQIEVHYPGGLV